MHGYQVDARGLALYRIVFAAMHLAVFVPSYSWISRYPNAFWAPPLGPFRLLHAFPPHGVLVGMDWALAAALVALLLGYRTTVASYAVGILIIAGNGFIYSFGKTDHLILAPLAAIILGWSGWGSAWSIDAGRSASRRRVDAWPVTLVLAATSLSMFTSGLLKLQGGWLQPRTHAAVAEVVWHRVVMRGGAPGAAPWGLRAEAIDWATVILEVGFPLVILFPDVCRAFAAAATLFHFAIWTTLEIDFGTQLLVYAVLLPWDAIAERLSRLKPGRAARVRAVVVRHPVIAVAGVAAAHIAIVTRAGPPHHSDTVTLIVHTAGACAGLAYLLYAARRLVRR